MKKLTNKKRNAVIAALMILTVLILVVTDKIINSSSDYPAADEIIKPFADSHDLKLSAWPDDLKSLLEKNPETEEFVLNYPLKKDLDEPFDMTEYENCTSVPHLMQWDTRWGYKEYAGSVIGVSGCGPTCLSMVSIYLLQDTSLTPEYIADFAEKNGFSQKNNGSKWTLMSEGAEKLGLKSTELPLDKNVMINALNDGKPIILIMGEGDFTSSGHFIVVTGYSDDGFTVLDPNSKERSDRAWTYERIEKQIRNIWCFENEE